MSLITRSQLSIIRSAPKSSSFAESLLSDICNPCSIQAIECLSRVKNHSTDNLTGTCTGKIWHIWTHTHTHTHTHTFRPRRDILFGRGYVLISVREPGQRGFLNCLININIAFPLQLLPCPLPGSTNKSTRCQMLVAP